MSGTVSMSALGTVSRLLGARPPEAVYGDDGPGCEVPQMQFLCVFSTLLDRDDRANLVARCNRIVGLRGLPGPCRRV